MDINKKLRNIPSVEKILIDPLFQEFFLIYSRPWIIEVIRKELDSCREDILSGKDIDLSIRYIYKKVSATINNAIRPSIRKIINATGTVVHTNLGRSLLPQSSIESMSQAAANSVNLEYNIKTGKRGDRDAHVEDLICRLTGAEAATVVNNNAAAVLLVLNSLSQRKEVIVSRGEMVEIGGSFRIPDIIKSSNCKLIEVGTTNRTKLNDYENAISKKTGVLLKVHTSNYRIEGFTESVSLNSLFRLGDKYSLPVIEDLGSGSILNLSTLNLPHEPQVANSISNGAYIITFSGDKLLGGPQCGIIAGKKTLIKKIKKNPLKRALRVDKIRLAALEELLRLYVYDKNPIGKIPTLKYLTRSLDELNTLALEVKEKLFKRLDSQFLIEIIESNVEPGSGSLPGESIPSIAIAIKHEKISAEKLATLFRKNDPPIIGRIYKNVFLLDLRCIENSDDIIPHPSINL